MPRFFRGRWRLVSIGLPVALAVLLVEVGGRWWECFRRTHPDTR